MGGISSIQFALPALWTAAKETWGWHRRYREVLSEKPALLPGLGKSKGRIQKGYDADWWFGILKRVSG